MGDHRILLKGPSPYDSVVRIPLLWKVPGMTVSGVSKSLVSTIDIPKTILSLLNIEKENRPPDMQGIDLTPALKDPSNKVRDCCLIEEDEERENNNKVRLRTLVTDDYKLTIYKGIDNYGDLFDRKNDPYELKNLWFDESCKEVRFKLVNKLIHEVLKAQSDYPHKQAIS
jgi:arylsulfatase A-like enzyme